MYIYEKKLEVMVNGRLICSSIDLTFTFPDPTSFTRALFFCTKRKKLAESFIDLILMFRDDNMTIVRTAESNIRG